MRRKRRRKNPVGKPGFLLGGIKTVETVETIETPMELRDFPDLDDMLRVGMSLPEALAFWNEIISSADRSVPV